MSGQLRGFTLIELCVTVAVAGVLIAIAVPGFMSVATGSTIRSVSSELAAHSYLARSEAIKLNRPTRLCASSNGSTCDGAEWSAGWIVLVQRAQADDTLVDGVLVKGAKTDQVVEKHGALPPGFTIVSTGGVREVTYRATGYGASGASLKVCRNAPAPGAEERVVSIDSSGKAYVTRTQTGACA